MLAETESRVGLGTEAGGAVRAPIRVLPEVVANQIAAGEVVERPASVVKELVENSLDAGATRISVELEQGGIELVQVRDDGCGVPREELPLALAPHATSKVRSVEDLDTIATLGFRGEALASIASVSRCRLRSRVASSDEAWELDCEGGQAHPLRPAPGQVGTTVSVRTLFFNTPARRKFLRTPQTEKERCVEVVTQLALAHPGVAFALRVDGRQTLDLPGVQGPRERTLAVLGKELEAQFVPVHADGFDDARGIALWGLAGLPSLARGSSKGQYVFVNGRCVRDKTVQHAVAEAYRGLVEHGRYPTIVLMLQMSPQGVDVNVHPQKAEVRFRDAGLVHSVVLRALREALAKADLTPSAGSLRPPLAYGPRVGVITRDLLGAVTPGPSGLLETSPSTLTHGVSAAKFAEFFSRFHPDTQQMPLSLAQGLEQQRRRTEPAPAPATPDVSHEVAPLPPPAAPGELAQMLRVPMLQVHDSYVITQDQEGVLIIDQHALHERAMFEFLLQRVSRGTLESQRLLAPVVVRVPPAQAGLLPALEPLLQRVGIDAALLGPGTIGVHAFPSFLFERGVDAHDFVEELLRKAEAGELPLGSPADGAAAAPLQAIRAGFEHALRDVLDMMACKAAIKAGDKLGDVELAALLQLREDVERSSNCPHGRPTSVRLTIRELEKLFGRA